MNVHLEQVQEREHTSQHTHGGAHGGALKV